MSVMSELDLIKRDLLEKTKDIISFSLVQGERIILGQLNKKLMDEEGKILFRAREFVLLVNRKDYFLCWSDSQNRPIKIENKSLINLMETL